MVGFLAKLWRCGALTGAALVVATVFGVVGSVAVASGSSARGARGAVGAVSAGWRFSATSRELRASVLRTRHADRSAPPVRAGAEVPWLRRADSDTFVAGSGRLVTKIYPSAVNYRTASGSFAPIDRTLVPSGSGYVQ